MFKSKEAMGNNFNQSWRPRLKYFYVMAGFASKVICWRHQLQQNLVKDETFLSHTLMNSTGSLIRREWDEIIYPHEQRFAELFLTPSSSQCRNGVPTFTCTPTTPAELNVGLLLHSQPYNYTNVSQVNQQGAPQTELGINSLGFTLLQGNVENSKQKTSHSMIQTWYSLKFKAAIWV